MSPRGHLAVFGDLFWEKGEAAGLWWVEARDAAEHPAVHRTALAINDVQHQMSVASALE